MRSDSKIHRGVSKMHLVEAFLLLTLFVTDRVISITLPYTETANTEGQDIINAGYAQCKPSNKACSMNNDCCSNCCVSATYSSMTCQDECPDKHNANEKQNNTHGNLVWKSKHRDEEKFNEGGARVVSRQHRGEDASKVRQSEGGVNIDSKVIPVVSLDKRRTMSGVEPKPNKDIGIRINEDDEHITNSSDTGTHENVEVGLSVIDLNKESEKDSGENENTDIGTPIIRISEKVKLDASGENLNTDVGTAVIKIVEKSKNKYGDKMRTFIENVKHAHSKEGSNKDLGKDVTQLQSIKEKSRIKDQQFNKIKILNNKTTLVPKDAQNELKATIVNENNNANKISAHASGIKRDEDSTTTNSTKVQPPCTGDTCNTSPSLVEDIKEMIIHKIPNILAIPTQATGKKPVCKAAGSSCKHPKQCCSQCCAVSDGAFKCFDKRTDECQSWVPGDSTPKCKEQGETCETHGECCLAKCTDCGHSSKCDNKEGNVCRVQGRQVTPAVRSKLCKSLGDICSEATECCTQCCALSGGVFKCFEEDTHECQPGDNVSNTTISEVVEAVGYEN